MARIPSIIRNQGEEMRKLTEERRKAWILAISREDLTWPRVLKAFCFWTSFRSSNKET